jgi:heme/copper-type cytochrome/quinol oxidase subunit 2
MIHRRWIGVLIAGMALSGVWAGAQESGSAAPEIKMTAKKYEFDPSTVTVKQGQHVKLVITALDRDHGFELKAFHINRHLKKGVPTTVEFTADRPGTFPFKCSDFCGLGHSRMKGKLVVEAASPPAQPQ